MRAFSDSFKVFLGLVAVLTAANLLLVNGYAGFWNGAESHMLLQAQAGRVDNPAGVVLEWVYQFGGLHHFLLRLPGLMVLLLAGAGFYYFGKKIFGREAVVMTLLVVAGSFVVIPVAKFVSTDVYLLLAQIMHLVFTILYVKQPVGKWRWGSYASLLLGLMIHPLAMAIWAAVTGIFLWWQHPRRQEVAALLWPGSIVIVGLLLCVNHLYGKWAFPGFDFSFGQTSFRQFMLILLFGFFPWWGLLPAALTDLWKKWRSGEELATITVAWLLGAMGSSSLAAAVVLAFLVGKHLWAVLLPGYPYLRLVKGFALLQLLLVFVGIVMVLVGGVVLPEGLSGPGLSANSIQSTVVTSFRGFVLLAAIYWMLALLGVMGLFLKDGRVVIGGMVLSGVVAMLIFWNRVYPDWETQRQVPRQVIKKAATLKKSGIETLTLMDAGWVRQPSTQIILNNYFTKRKILKDTLELKRQLAHPEHQIFVWDDAHFAPPDSSYMHRATVTSWKEGWGYPAKEVYILGSGL